MKELFTEVCEDVTKTATKIPQSMYLSNGKTPIFDNETMDLWIERLKNMIYILNYKYYHLLSGTTLLTKPLDEFYSFYDNTDLEYFHINRHTFKSIQKRCKYYYPFIKTKVFRKSKFVKGLSLIFGQIQAIIGINRLRKSPLNPIYNGMEWFSITDDYCRYILSKENLIYKTFHHTLAAEEVFVQTLAMHSDEFKNRVYGFNGKDDHIDASKTYQFWNSGKSTVIKTKEQLEIVQKDKRCFFARKFIDD